MKPILTLFLCIVSQVIFSQKLIYKVEIDTVAAITPKVNELITEFKNYFKDSKKITLTDFDQQAPNYLVVIQPQIIDERIPDVPIFKDSLQSFWIPMKVRYGPFVPIKIFSIETGELLVSEYVNHAIVPEMKMVAVSYMDVGYAKGRQLTSVQRSQLYTEIFKKARAKYDYDANIAIQRGIGYAAYNLSRVIRTAIPYSVKILPNSLDPKAKELIVDKGAEYGLNKGYWVTAYTIDTVNSGGKNFVKVKQAGQLLVNEVKDGIVLAKPKIRKKRIKGLMETGVPIYCNEGDYPLVKITNSEARKVAIASVKVPKNVDDKSYSSKVSEGEFEIARKQDWQLLSRSKMDLLKEQKELQKSDEQITDQTIDQYKMIGADYLVFITVSEPHVGEASQQNMTYPIITPIKSDLIEVSTGKVIATYSKKDIQYVKVIPANLSKATFNRIFLDVTGLLNSAFEPEIRVIDIEEESKGKAKEVVVTGDVLFSPWTKYEVSSVKFIEVDGVKKPRFTKLGELSIKSVESPGVAIANVKEGEKEIFEALMSDQLVVCKYKPGILERMGDINQKYTN